MIIVDGKQYSGFHGLMEYLKYFNGTLWYEVNKCADRDDARVILNQATGLTVLPTDRVIDGSNLFLEALHKKLQATA